MEHRTRFPSPPALAVALVLPLTLGCGAAEGGTRAEAPAPADEDAPPEPGMSYPELRATICDTILNSFRCARAIEARQRPRSEAVTRSGDTLRLALAHEDTVGLVDRTGDHSDVVLYSYQEHWPDVGLYLVQVQYYEGSAFQLVNDRTGATTWLPDWPLRSPDGARFAVLSLDLEAGYGPNTLQIWRLEDGQPLLLWEIAPDAWGPKDGEWAGPETLRLTQWGYCERMGLAPPVEERGPGGGYCERPARVTRVGGEWRLETLHER